MRRLLHWRFPGSSSLSSFPVACCLCRRASVVRALGSYLCAETWFGATITMLLGAVPTRIQGAAQGLLNCVQVLSSLSPPLIGALYRGGVPLRLLLSLLVPGSYALTALCFWRAAGARQAEGDTHSGRT